MISVPWMIDMLELQDNPPKAKYEAIGKFFYALGREPWVEFLFEHQTKIDVESFYDAPTMMHNIMFRFHLPPEQETMYRLRFS
jgi:hypothetical protein